MLTCWETKIKDDEVSTPINLILGIVGIYTRESITRKNFVPKSIHYPSRPSHSLVKGLLVGINLLEPDTVVYSLSYLFSIAIDQLSPRVQVVHCTTAAWHVMMYSPIITTAI
jgi:hypothetical protein